MQTSKHSASTETPLPSSQSAEVGPFVAEVMALLIAWSAGEPERVGQVALLPPDSPRWLLGRSPLLPGQPSQASPNHELPYERRVHFFHQRPPGVVDPDPAESELATTQLHLTGLSRRQLEIQAGPECLQVRNVGRCRMRVNGQPTTEAILSVGDTLYLEDQLLLLCIRRPLELPPLRYYPKKSAGRFGQPDADGIVGESPVMWRLREQLAACARSDFHVLVVGGSGSGKELAVHAIHRLSRRAGQPLIADNIAVMPTSLAAALLFGNRKNFPNPGMEERAGLIGAADGGTLFLDEIGDMPTDVQPMFLRVTERSGQYFRLGDEARPRRSNFRLIGATNRPQQLRYELKRRFQREISIPGLNQRREDIPLLIRHLLLMQAANESAGSGYCVESGPGSVHPLLIEQLLRYEYTTHISEIGFLLGQAMADSPDDMLLPLNVSRSAVTSPALRPSQRSKSFGQLRVPSRPLPAPERAQQAIDSCNGDITRAAKQLEISRYQLNRLIRRSGLRVIRVRDGGSSPCRSP